MYRVVIGYDEGTIMVKLGREVPVASMDNSGKVIWAKHNEVQTVNIKSIGADYEVGHHATSTFAHLIVLTASKLLYEFFFCFSSQVADGERLPLAVKEMGTCDLYPQVSLIIEYKYWCNLV